MNRMLYRLGIATASAAAAGMLVTAPALAAPSATSPAAFQQTSAGESRLNAVRLALADDYVLDFGRYHVPGDDKIEWKGGWIKHPVVTHYYYYVELRAPGDMQQEVWDRTSHFVSCVINNAGLALVVSTVATGGTSVPAFVAAFSAASSLCGSTTLDEMSQAWVSIRHDT